ncbi:hypothetical protein TrLO_g7995 [Triparma laevis f. longispina]|uniref:C2H2-type domain-containing protein n=1 Tax=Triparma laevis f. longispina TaxID=1714387 RepID=A0A9W6ZXB1_9STRA|nr:hypothetical protein TrLO_g7995 [Triparma laevis f. longispina]
MSYVLASKEEDRRHSVIARELWRQWFVKDSDDVVPTTAAFGEEMKVEVAEERSADLITTPTRKHSHNWVEGVERDKRGNIIRTCGIDGCEYKTGQTGSMKSHKAAKHGINVVWFSCNQENCDYFKAKLVFNIEQHKQHTHNLGVVWHQ